MKYAFAGDRKISCNILKYIMSRGFEPSMLLVSNKKDTTHAKELIKISELSEDKIIRGELFSNFENIEKLNSLELDYVIGVHFPYIIPKTLLACAKVGFINLHPAYLPYNKGWHTPTWAILDKTKYGATLHFMAEALDAGDIINQKTLKVTCYDTADSLYKKVLELEEKVFIESFDDLLTLSPKRLKQTKKGTSHNKKDLRAIKEINLEASLKTKDIIDRLRALTTNDISESAYFTKGNKKYAVQIKITKID